MNPCHDFLSKKNLLISLFLPPPPPPPRFPPHSLFDILYILYFSLTDKSKRLMTNVGAMQGWEQG